MGSQYLQPCDSTSGSRIAQHISLGLTRFASVHPTRDSEATETNDLNKIELLNTTGEDRVSAGEKTVNGLI